jgi:DNA polymerase-4/protein ImuB
VAASRAKPGAGIVIHEGEEGNFLTSQSVAILPLGPDAHHRLWRLGLKTLGQLVAVPEEAVAAQFGREGRVAWRLAAGLVNDPVVGRQTPEPIVAGMDFPAPVADRTILAGTIERLIEQALRHPRRTGWRVSVVRVRAGLEQGASWMTEAMLKDPSAERVRIAAPLLVKLEHAPPTGAVQHLTVEFTAFGPGTTELQLFARDAQAAARAGRRRALRAAAGEIKTRLNRSILSRVIEVHPWSRLPERRYALIDFDP